MFIFLLVNPYSVGDKTGNLGNYTEHAPRISNSVRKHYLKCSVCIENLYNKTNFRAQIGVTKVVM